MTETLKSIVALAKLIREMETSLGFGGLNNHEKAVIYALKELESQGVCHDVHEIWEQELASEMSRATLFRTVKSLEEKGFVKRFGGDRNGKYSLA